MLISSDGEVILPRFLNRFHPQNANISSSLSCSFWGNIKYSCSSVANPKWQNIIDFNNLKIKPLYCLEIHFMAVTSVHCCSLNTFSQFLWACGGPAVDLWWACGKLAENMVDLGVKS